MAKLIRNHPIFSFFILTFILSWLFGFPAVFFSNWPGIFTLLMVFMPAISAIIVILLTGRKQYLLILLGSLKKWRYSWYCYLFVLLFPAITMITTIFVFSKTNKLTLDASFPLFHLNFSHILFLVSILFYQLVIVWGEELGWRGYALPELQKKMHPIYASILLGLVWGLWHLPYFFMEGSAQENIPFWFFILSTIGYSIIYSSIFNGTNESTWMASLFHAANNTTVSFTMMFVPQILSEPVITLIILLGFDLLLILITGPGLLHRPNLTT